MTALQPWTPTTSKEFRIVIIRSRYTPRAIFDAFHARKERYAIGLAHRRAGKTVACINDGIKLALECPIERCKVSYIAPFRQQGKDIAWEYLKAYSRPLWGRPPSEAELFVELKNEARIKICGADNPEALRGGYLDYVILDEFGNMAPSIWGSIIRPQLSDRNGRATFIGTPNGRNHFYDMFQHAKTDPDWFWFALPASETAVLSQEELDANRRELTPEQYAQEFENSFDAAIQGAYYGKDIADLEATGRIREIAIEPDAPVHTAWDLGYSDSTAIWFWQAIGPEVHVVDFYINHGQSLAHYASVLASKGYRYGHDYVPQDAKFHEYATGRNRVQTMIELGLKPALVAKHKIMDGINAVRVLMPRIWFDAARCHEGIEALRQYHCEYDEKKRALNDKPYHNFASHPADAFRYLAVAYKELAPAPRAPVVSTERFIAPPYEMPPGEHRICIDLSDMNYDDYEEIGRRRVKERA